MAKKQKKVLSAREMQDRVDRKWWGGTATPPTTEVSIPIDTQIYTRSTVQKTPLYKDPAFYGAVGMGALTAGGILYVYRRSAAVRSVRDMSPSPVTKPTPSVVSQAVSSDKPLRISFPEALKTGLQLKDQLETIFDAPLEDYRRSGWADSRLLLDFTDPFNPKSKPCTARGGFEVDGSKRNTGKWGCCERAVRAQSRNPKESADLLVDYLRRHHCIRLDKDFVVDVDLGRFNTIPFVKIYGAPRKVEMSNARVTKARRVSASARPLHPMY